MSTTQTLRQASVTLKEMRARVKKELEAIPDWPAPQGELRMVYWSMRMNSLGKKAAKSQSAKDVLQDCIRILKKDHPNFEFKFDRESF